MKFGIQIFAIVANFVLHVGSANSEDLVVMNPEEAIESLWKNLKYDAPEIDLEEARRAIETVRSYPSGLTCLRQLPSKLKARPGIEGFGPSTFDIVIHGGKERVLNCKRDVWRIRYLGGTTSNFQAYVDSSTGAVLLAYIIPEG